MKEYYEQKSELLSIFLLKSFINNLLDQKLYVFLVIKKTIENY